MLTKEQVQDEANAIQDAIMKKDTGFLIGNIAMSLLRISAAQEEIVAMSQMDLESAVEAEIEERSKTKAEEIVASTTKRSFIGKTER